MAAVATFLAPLRRLHAGVNATPMPYEPGTTECRVLIDSKAQLELMLLNLAKLENTESIRQQLVAMKPAFVDCIEGGRFIPEYGEIVSSTPEHILNRAG